MLLQKFKDRFLSAVDLDNKRILLMLSGGVDSMVCLDLLMRLKEDMSFDLGVFSLDHMLRGDEAISDMEFVRSHVNKLGLPLHSYRRDIRQIAAVSKLGEEEAARKTRYRLAEAVKFAYAYDFIVSCHHLDDDVESVMLHFIRGSGPDGFRGIAYRKESLIRPLLGLSKAEILEYARINDIDYREDSTNSESDYRRNFLRNEIIPLIKKINPNFSSAVARSCEIISAENDFLEKFCRSELKRLSGLDFDKLPVKNGTKFSMNLESLNSLHIALRRRIFLIILRSLFKKSDIYSGMVVELIKLSENKNHGKFCKFGNLIFTVERTDLSVELKPENPSGEDIGSELSEKKLQLGPQIFGKFKLIAEEIRISHKSDVESVPELKIEGCFDYFLLPSEYFEKSPVWRGRREGDRISPPRLRGGSKSVKKLFIDRKLGPAEKKSAVLLADMSNILWIVGIEKDRIQENILKHFELYDNFILIKAYLL